MTELANLVTEAANRLGESHMLQHAGVKLMGNAAHVVGQGDCALVQHRDIACRIGGDALLLAR